MDVLIVSYDCPKSNAESRLRQCCEAHHQHVVQISARGGFIQTSFSRKTSRTQISYKMYTRIVICHFPAKESNNARKCNTRRRLLHTVNFRPSARKRLKIYTGSSPKQNSINYSKQLWKQNEPALAWRKYWNTHLRQNTEVDSDRKMRQVGSQKHKYRTVQYIVFCTLPTASAELHVLSE